MELVSVLTCPECGHAERLQMPTDACVVFHECAGCLVSLKTELRRLLRVLLVWLRQMSASSGGARLLCTAGRVGYLANERHQ
jgi:hypothetical protein